MPRQCSVISCKSSEKKSVTLFKIRASNFDSWNNIIRKVNGNKKRKVTYVCAAHFTDEDLITTYSGPPDLDLIKVIKCKIVNQFWNYTLNIFKLTCLTIN